MEQNELEDMTLQEILDFKNRAGELLQADPDTLTPKERVMRLNFFMNITDTVTRGATAFMETEDEYDLLDIAGLEALTASIRQDVLTIAAEAEAIKNLPVKSPFNDDMITAMVATLDLLPVMIYAAKARNELVMQHKQQQKASE